MHEDFKEQGIILRMKPHGETGAIVTVFAQQSGLLTGYVYAVHSRQNVQYFQLGNLIDFTYTRKKSFDFGSYTAHHAVPLWYFLQDRPEAFYAFTALCDILWFCLPKEVSEPVLYQHFLQLMSFFKNDDRLIVGKMTCYFLIEMLKELGFSPDIYHCAVTGQSDNLCYFSPKTARVVSYNIGKPYHDKLWPCPAFLQDETADMTYKDIVDALKICGFLVEKNLFFPQQKYLPENFMRLYEYYQRGISC